MAKRKNRLEKMLEELKKDMSSKGLRACHIAPKIGLSNTSISHILNGKSGSFAKLKVLIDYIDGYEPRP